MPGEPRHKYEWAQLSMTLKCIMKTIPRRYIRFHRRAWTRILFRVKITQKTALATCSTMRSLIKKSFHPWRKHSGWVSREPLYWIRLSSRQAEEVDLEIMLLLALKTSKRLLKVRWQLPLLLDLGRKLFSTSNLRKNGHDQLQWWQFNKQERQRPAPPLKPNSAPN